MGSSYSTEKLEIPLHAQSPAVLATSHGVVATKFTSLSVIRPSGWGSTLQVTDAHTKQHLFEFKTKSSFTTTTSRHTLQTPDGRALASVKRRSSHYQVYDGGEQATVSFDIHGEAFDHHGIVADFYDRISGRQCRVLLDAKLSDRVGLFYLEYGQPDLPPKPRQQDRADSHRFQAIGRIRRPNEEDFVEAAPGVDLTLLLLMWRVWKHLKDE